MQGDLTADVRAIVDRHAYGNNVTATTEEDDNSDSQYAGSARRSSEPLHTYLRVLSSTTENPPAAHPSLAQYQSSSFDGCLEEESQSSIRKLRARLRRKYSAAAIQQLQHGGPGRRKLIPLQFAQKSQSVAMLSPDMEAKIYEKIRTSLGKKYGSLERVTQAAVTIQKAYRAYKLRKHFDEIRREGTAQMSRRSSVAAKERRQILSMVRQQSIDLYELDLMLGVDDVKSSDVCGHQGVLSGGAPDADALVALADSNGGLCQVESPTTLTPTPTTTTTTTRTGHGSSKLRRSKSLTTTATTIVRVEDSEGGEVVVEEEEEEEGEEEGDDDEAAHWKRRVGILLFNRKPASGIQYLISKGIVSDTPKSVARFLREQDGLSKLKIGEFVGEIRYEFNMAVLEHMAHSINMQDKPIDEALREFQTLFLMPGEAQKIDKIMQIFAAEYIDANDLKFGAEDSTHVLSVLEYLSTNQSEFETEDAVYVLSFSIMMLHTSLHNPSVKNRDSKQQWIKMNRGINGGGNFSKQFLLEIYDRIQKTSFVTGNDHTKKVAEIQKRLVGSDILKQSAPHRCFVDEVTVYELDKVNSWKRGKHKRVLLMFNDLVVVTKKNKEQYMFKQSFSLLNATAVSYQSADLPEKYGIQMYSSMDTTPLFQCCCRTKSEYETLLKILNDSIKLLNLLEKERITASQEQPHRHDNMRLKSSGLLSSVKPLSRAKSTTCLSVVGNLHCDVESSLLGLRPLSAANLSMLSMPLENLNHLDEVPVDKTHMHSLSRSMSNIRSVEAPSFDGSEDTSFDVVNSSSFDVAVKDPSFDMVKDLQQIDCHPHASTSEQNQREKRAPSLSAGKLDRGLCDVNQLIPYAFHTSTVSVV